jgi:thiosulfate dehydrogenase (quinone) large subunit
MHNNSAERLTAIKYPTTIHRRQLHEKRRGLRMAENTMVDSRGEITIPDPPIAHILFSTTKFAWLWLILRVYLGWTWLTSGWGKISGGAWMTGEPLRGFWTGAVEIPAEGRPDIAFGWYRNFLQFMLDNGWYTWFAPLIAWGETLIGIALILGALTGIAAFFGAFMNWNFIMAGSASTNGMLLALAILLVLAWKVAGWWGLDRWLLPKLGTPWYRGGSKPEQVVARRT